MHERNHGAHPLDVDFSSLGHDPATGLEMEAFHFIGDIRWQDKPVP